MVAERLGSFSGVTESCWRCGSEMEWRQSTWQCPHCLFKLGCCEGEAHSESHECEPPAVSLKTWPSSKHVS